MVRAFEDRPLPAASVNTILKNAQRGPSAGFAQGFEFLALEGAAATGRYWQATLPEPRRTTFPWPGLLKAPLLVVCFSNKLAYLRRYAEPDKGWGDMDEARWPVPYWDVDAGMAALLMLLTAVDEGLSACFFGAPAEPLREAFGIPADYSPIGTVAIGYAASKDDRPSASLRRGRRAQSEVIHLGKW